MPSKSKHNEGPFGAHIWAPEIHYVDGNWYIYFAAGGAEDVWAIRMYVLQNKSDNPLTGVKADSLGQNSVGSGKLKGGAVQSGNLASGAVNSNNMSDTISISTSGTVEADSFNGGGMNIDGDLKVNGSVSKAGGAFEINHPLDPDNKILRHSFMESPEMKNVYDGVIKTNDNGKAVVNLPDYFEALNKDFKYQLTVIGQKRTELKLKKRSKI